MYSQPTLSLLMAITRKPDKKRLIFKGSLYSTIFAVFVNVKGRGATSFLGAIFLPFSPFLIRKVRKSPLFLFELFRFVLGEVGFKVWEDLDEVAQSIYLTCYWPLSSFLLSFARWGCRNPTQGWKFDHLHSSPGGFIVDVLLGYQVHDGFRWMGFEPLTIWRDVALRGNFRLLTTLSHIGRGWLRYRNTFPLKHLGQDKISTDFGLSNE